MFRLTNLINSTFDKKEERILDGGIAIWNITNRCNLNCYHCYSKSGLNGEDNLSTNDILKTLPSLVESNIKFIIFSGGEPLLRKDLFEITERCKELGIKTYLSTNGIYITEKNIEKISKSFDYIGISIDGEKEIHDSFRRMKGAFAHSINAVKMLLPLSKNVGIRFTLTKKTLNSLKFMFNLVESYKIPKLYISHLVYSGRGLDNLKMDISQRTRRKVISFILEKAFYYRRAKKKIDIVTGNMEPDAVFLLKRFKKDFPEYYEILYKKLMKWGGNSAGKRLVNIDSFGNVKPDPFFPFILGNIKERDFKEIWFDNKNPLLQKLRETPRKLKGKCGRCKFINICNGGSRSRAFAVYNDLWAEDPSCYLTEEEIKEVPDVEKSISSI